MVTDFNFTWCMSRRLENHKRCGWVDRAIEESVMTKRAISGDTRTASHKIDLINLDAITRLNWEMFCDDYPEAVEALMYLSTKS